MRHLAKPVRDSENKQVKGIGASDIHPLRAQRIAAGHANREERGQVMQQAWEGFTGGIWEREVDVRDFIQRNYTPYEGDESFLVGPTERTKKLWGTVLDLLEEERAKGGALDIETKVVTGITAYPAGYIVADHPELETIVGLQTDKPLKRALHVNGGIRIACQAA